MAARTKAPELRQEPEAEIAGHRSRLDLHPPVDAPEPAAPGRGGENRLCQARRQDRAHLLDAGLEILDDRERLARLELQLIGDADEARGIDLRLGDPDDVLERHAHRERSEERRVGKECRSRWSPY